jgi:Peptidase family M28
VIDLRLWRIALLPVAAALLIAMFSLEETPRALEPALPPDAFDGEAAASLARDLAATHAGPTPGSEQDATLAEAVLQRFEDLGVGELSEQRWTQSVDGEDVELRNVIMVLPGQTERQIALLAPRDAAAGPGAASGIASTATMLEIASALAGSTHDKTLVFVSTDGSTAGAAGARRFASDYSDTHLLDAAIVLSQPGSPDPSPPLVVPWSSGPESTGIQLVESARSSVEEEVARPAGDEGPLRELFRLALPSALGEQGPLIESGIDAVRLSSHGELPLPAGADRVEEVNTESVARFGRAALGLIIALDPAPSPTEHGPGAYVGLAGSLLPGWTISLLALSLLLPVLGVAGIGIARAASTPLAAARAVGWAALRAIPFVVAAAVLYALTVVGVLPGPDFPFDPAREELDLGGAIAIGVALLVFGGVAFLTRPLLAPPTDLARLAPAASLGLAAAAALALWAVNPYLGLLVAVGLQALVPAAAGVGGRRLAAAGFVLLACLPVLLALADLAGRFDSGPGVVWDLVFMFSGEQLSDKLIPLTCVLAGAAVAVIASQGEALPPGTAQPSLSALVERGRELEERRTEGRARVSRRGRKARARDEERRRRRERAHEELAEPPAADEEAEPPPENDGEDGAQAEPARDPRIWSKPDASIFRPWESITVAPEPSIT